MNVVRAYSSIHSHAYLKSFKFSQETSEKTNKLFLGKKTEVTPFPDQHLAKMFKKRYQNTDDHFTLGRVLLYPKTITNYWRVAKSMQKKGLIPFVHGQTMVWAIPQRILKALGFEGCRLLRNVNAHSLKTSHEIRQIIQSSLVKQKIHSFCQVFPFIKRENPPDYNLNLRIHLLAVTLGLFHLEIKESPFSFAVGGSYKSHSGYCTYEYEGNRNALPMKKCIQLANQMIVEAMDERGVNSIMRLEVLNALKNLYEEAAQLPVGQIIVCGVPVKNLSTAVYHSKPLGIPTEFTMHQILEGLLIEKPNPHCYQARLLFSQEAMTQRSSVEIVNIMDESAVMHYTKGVKLLPLEEGLKDVIEYSHTEQENAHLHAIQQLYAKIDQIGNRL